MEQYLWMTIGSVVVGFFAKTYWDVYQAYRAYMKTVPLPGQDDLAGAALTTAPVPPKADLLGWLLNKGDRALHIMLMSPISR